MWIMQAMKRGVNNKKPKCPRCDSQNVLFKKKTKTSWCRVCGHEWSSK